MRPNETSRADKTASETRSSFANRRGVRAKNSPLLSSPKRVKRRLEVAGPKRVLMACGVLFASGLLGAVMSSNYAQWRQYDAQADDKAQQLSALQTQHDAMKRRLAFSQLPKGREQALMEHNYLKPGDRYLLFPQEDKKTTPPIATTSTRNVRSVSAPSDEDPQSETPQNLANDNAGHSAWSRAGSNVSRWWNDVNRATPSSAATGSAPNATP